MLEEERSSVGNMNGAVMNMCRVNAKRRAYFTMPMTEEEITIRNELALEIEKELEEEIKLGIILYSMHRSNDFKGK
ncbi:hypothetical protein ACHQM5_014524 [Ranunculus cassubicifolius]